MIPRVDHKSTQNTRGHRRGVIRSGSPPHDVVEEVIGVDLAELPLARLGEVAHGGATPPLEGIPGTNQPGLPRKPEEVKRATAIFKAQGCDVKTNGGRIEQAMRSSTIVRGATLERTIQSGGSASSLSGSTSASDVTRIEIQTADPNIKIIWLAARASRESKAINRNEYKEANDRN